MDKDLELVLVELKEKGYKEVKAKYIKTLKNTQVKNFYLNEKFDIIFLDPPYKTDFDIQALEIIINNNLIAKDGIVVLETNSDEKIERIEGLNINILKVRKYGRVKLVFLNWKGKHTDGNIYITWNFRGYSRKK